MLSAIAIIHDDLLLINRVYTSAWAAAPQDYFFGIVALRIEVALGGDADVAALSFGCDLLLSSTLGNSACGLLIRLLYEPSKSSSCGFQRFYRSAATVRRVVFAQAVFGGQWRRLIWFMNYGGRLLRRKVVLRFLKKSTHSVFYLRSRNIWLAPTWLLFARGQVCALFIIRHWRFAHYVLLNCLKTFILF